MEHQYRALALTDSGVVGHIGHYGRMIVSGASGGR